LLFPVNDVRLYVHMSKVHIEIKKTPNENSVNVLRRFSRKVSESGIVQKVKSKRYNERPLSKLAQKTLTIKKINRRKETEVLKKLGKIIEKKKRR
jgi:ribosomal protein S21